MVSRQQLVRLWIFGCVEVALTITACGADCQYAGAQLREYPLYFMAVRAHFITGLLFFAGGLAIRMYIEYRSGCSRFAR